MESVILVIHLIFAMAIIGLVLLQRSEGGGLGIGGGGGGLGGLASAKGTANALTKMTAICAAGFFVTSLTLGVLASKNAQQNIGLLENVDTSQIESLSPDDLENGSSDTIKYIPPEEIEDNTNQTGFVQAPENSPETAAEQTTPPQQPEAGDPSAPIE